MIPRHSGRREHIASVHARRHASGTITCKGCRRPVSPDRAAITREHFKNLLGITESTIAQSLPICTACARVVIDLALEIRENRND